MAKDIKVIIGSVRSARVGESVADWVMKSTAGRDHNYELVDLKELNLPWYDEPAPPMMGNEYAHESTRNWSDFIRNSDGFVFVTPEYNHGYSPALKNAVDHLFAEWKDKPAGLVGYGGGGAVHSIRQFREVLEFIGMKPLEDQVGINEIWSAFDEEGNLKNENISGSIEGLLDTLETALVGEPVGAAG